MTPPASTAAGVELDLVGIEARAKAATPGPWFVGPFHTDVLAPSEKGGETKIFDIRGWGYFTGQGHGALGLSPEEGRARQAANGAHVAGLSPEVVLALVATARSADKYAAENQSLLHSQSKFRARAEDAEARVKELEEELRNMERTFAMAVNAAGGKVIILPEHFQSPPNAIQRTLEMESGGIVIRALARGEHDG